VVPGKEIIIHSRLVNNRRIESPIDAIEQFHVAYGGWHSSENGRGNAEFLFCSGLAQYHCLSASQILIPFSSSLQLRYSLSWSLVALNFLLEWEARDNQVWLSMSGKMFPVMRETMRILHS
jgi:hypothetical protein